MKNKKKFYYFFALGLILVVSFFIWQKKCSAEPILKIIDIQFEGEKSDEDFIKIENTTEKDIVLDDYRLAKQTSSGKKYNLKSFEKENIIPAGKTYLWASSKIESYPDSIKADISTAQTISKDNGVAILFGSLEEGATIDSVNWKEDEDEGEKEEEDEKDDEEEKEDYSKIKINEIYPAPDTKNKEEEFIEIINESGEDIDFSDWIVKDSKGKKGKISRTEKNGKFFVFYGSFSLNNDSKGDEVFLYDKNENPVDNEKYTNGKSAYSYSFEGSGWRWTSSSTPGQENVFDKILSGKIIRDEKVYVNMYAYFDVKADKDATKFTWDFGDGHKSYLQSTKHKYEKTGKYSASLKISGKGEDKLYEFEVKVEKYKAPKVRIIALSPNPQGNDTDNEWIEIKNESKKKINLKDWSIATGWEKFVNHPIRENFEIKAGKTKKLLRDICAFTLVNTKDKIELRSPDGKAVQKIEYDHGEKSAEENEIYQMADGDWNWINSSSKEIADKKETTNITEEIIFNISDSEIQANLGKYSHNPNWENKKIESRELAYSGFGINIPEKILKNNMKVLGAKTIQIQNNHYVFTNPTNREHWIVIWSKNIFGRINFKLNFLLSKLF